jgi:hypothetical protein
MSSADFNELPVVDASTPPCRHLRNKGMYVYTDGVEDDPNADHDTTIYWCLQTMKGFGPDDEFVDARECRMASRSCYEPT